MEIRIPGKMIPALIELGEEINEKLSYAIWRSPKRIQPARTYDVRLDFLEIDELEAIRDLLKEHKHADAKNVGALIKDLKSGQHRFDDLHAFSEALEKALKDNKHKWLFRLSAEEKAIAYLPVAIKYTPEDRRRNYQTDESVMLSMVHNAKQSSDRTSVTWYRRDLPMSVPEALRKNGLIVATSDLMDDYATAEKKFYTIREREQDQVWVRRQGYQDGGRWYDREAKQLTVGGQPTTAVVDMEETNTYFRSHADTFLSDKPYKVPQHHIVRVFSLHYHSYLWVSVTNMATFKYEENLMEKLVLPTTHAKLVGALVSNLDVLRDESDNEEKSNTLGAKAQSCIILAKGPAGTGKTLTAEIYANEIKRPLYEIQSGQLGMDPETIEQNLEAILNRSVRLNMPILINEADTFVKSRGDDMEQNAVVAVFLRLLEYHSGLVFLTTNRSEDIDDAILSRCIAVIQYSIPERADRLRLWKIQLAEFNQTLTKDELSQIADVFPKIVGRDIQNLIRLTSRVCKATDETFSLKALTENATFRGIEVMQPKKQ